MPEERIELRGGGVVTGYVMDVHSPYTEILTPGDRKIRFIMTSDVVSRADAG